MEGQPGLRHPNPTLSPATCRVGVGAFLINRKPLSCPSNSLRMQKNAFVISLAFFLGMLGAQGQSLYVAPGGRDIQPGTRAEPLATLAGARDRARQLRQAGPLTRPLIIHIAPGTYMQHEPLRLTAEDAGTPESPLIFEGSSRHPAVISGGRRLPPFTRVNDSLWEMRVPDDVRGFEQLYVNDRRAIRARTPNTGVFFHVAGAREKVITPGQRVASRAQLRVSVEPQDLAWMKTLDQGDQAGLVVTFYHNWDITRKHPSRLSVRDSAMYFEGEGMKPWNPINDRSIYMVENAKAFLDAPGEWYLDDNGMLFYVPRPGETISTTEAEVPVSDQFVVLEGKPGHPVAHIQFRNLLFRTAGYHMPAGGNEPSQAAASIDATVMADHARDIRFERCEIAHTGLYAAWFREDCRQLAVTHCYLHDLGAGGIKIGGTTIPKDSNLLTRQIIVDNNIIRSGGYVFPTGVGVLIFQASDNQITHNEIADLGYSGVSVGWVWGYSYSPSKRNNITWNHIHHLGRGILSDMGGVYTLGASEGTVVSHNIIHDVFSRAYGGWGLYTDEGSSGIHMEDNLVYHCKSSSFHQHYGQDNFICNNIFALGVKAQLEATRVEDHNSFTFTHNIIYFNDGLLFDKQWATVHFVTDSNAFFDTRGRDIRFGKQTFHEWQQSGKDVHSVIGDPGFNPEKQQFRVRNKSMRKAIGFRPFDIRRNGVYGNHAWKRLAEFDPSSIAHFKALVQQNSD